jgi:hypothetical protein
MLSDSPTANGGAIGRSHKWSRGKNVANCFGRGATSASRSQSAIAVDICCTKNVAEIAFKKKCSKLLKRASFLAVLWPVHMYVHMYKCKLFVGLSSIAEIGSLY